MEVKKMTSKLILEVVHETAKGLHKAGAMDATTMREFDALCLPPVNRAKVGAGQEATQRALAQIAQSRRPERT